MAGRGTDIKLGEGVRELGGLCVLGSERHESRRIDNQLRGRSGRQGDPGMSRFYISVQDDLMVRFAPERFEALFASLGDTAIESKTITRSISSAQKRVEGVNYDARKQLLQYDDVMRQQRETMYEQRDFILEHDDIHSFIKNMFKRVVSELVASYTNQESGHLDTEGYIKALDSIGFEGIVKIDDIDNRNDENVIAITVDKAWQDYDDKIDPVRDQITDFERNMTLNVIDRAWSDHIDNMSKLRDGIGLRSYAQSNPLQAYVTEGFQMFEEMQRTISHDVVNYCMNVKVVQSEEESN